MQRNRKCLYMIILVIVLGFIVSYWLLVSDADEINYREMEEISCQAKPAFSSVFVHKSHSQFPDTQELVSDHIPSAAGRSAQLETCIFVPPPVFLESNEVSPGELASHVLLSAYQVQWWEDSNTQIVEAPAQSQLSVIPRIVHYVFISRRTYKFSLLLYLSIRAAYLRIKPDAIYLHCFAEPIRSPYYILSSSMISKIIIHKPVTQIFGNRVKVVEHMSDIVRMKALLKYGGIYMDTDVISLKSFDTFLHHLKPMTMGMERQSRLPNTIMIGQRNNSFLYRWLRKYDTFNDKEWGIHSVIWPSKLAKLHPHEINIEDRHAFFYPFYNTEGIQTFFRTTSMKKAMKPSYATHLWRHLNSHYLNPLTPSIIFDCDIGLNEILRPLLPHSFVSFSIKLAHDKEFSLKLLRTIAGISRQSFPLWEIIIDTSNVGDSKDLAYLTSENNLCMPYYSCNFTSLFPNNDQVDQADLSRMKKLTNDLGEKIRGSVFSRLRCGDVSIKETLSFPMPKVVNFDDELGTEPIMPSTIHNHGVVPRVLTPRGVWFVNVNMGEVLPDHFLDNVFSSIKTKSSNTVTVNVRGVKKYVHFVFGRNLKN